MGRKEKWGRLFSPRLKHFTDVWPDKQDATCGTCDRLEAGTRQLSRVPQLLGFSCLRNVAASWQGLGDALNSLIPAEKPGKITKRT